MVFDMKTEMYYSIFPSQKFARIDIYRYLLNVYKDQRGGTSEVSSICSS